MCHTLLQNPRFFQSLLDIDRALAKDMQQKGCSFCHGVLHCANYARKPRGLPSDIDPEHFSFRLSYCCTNDLCRKRHTPVSVLFIRHKVYLGIVVTLSCLLLQGVSQFRLNTIESLGIPKQTIYRWLAWWQGEFITTPLWRSLQNYFSKATLIPRDPILSLKANSLLEQLMLWLHHIRPISVTCAMLLRVRDFPQRL